MAEPALDPEPINSTPSFNEIDKWDFITEEFLRSRLEPPQEVVDEMNARHLEFLDELDRELGPPSEEDHEWTRQALKDVGFDVR